LGESISPAYQARRAKPASKVDFDKEIIMRSFSSASTAAVALGNFLGL